MDDLKIDRTVRPRATMCTEGTHEYRIMQYLSMIDRPQSPAEIASFLKIKPSVVRARLSDLRKRALVSRPYHGAYLCDPTYGVGRHRPRVQNLRVSARGVRVRVHAEVVHVVGDLRLRMVFGTKRGIVSYSVAAPVGLDMYGVRLIHFIAVGEAEARGYVDLNWEFTVSEFLTDHGGLRLEGLQCVTLDDLCGQLEKYYYRPGLRREVRATSRRMSMTELSTLLDGGMSRFQVVSGLQDIKEALGELTTAQKWGNKLLQTFARGQSESR